MYNSKIIGDNHEELHVHKEADIRILHQVLALTAESTAQDLCVSPSDTDVLVLHPHLVACGHLPADTGLKVFFTGMCT